MKLFLLKTFFHYNQKIITQTTKPSVAYKYNVHIHLFPSRFKSTEWRD